MSALILAWAKKNWRDIAIVAVMLGMMAGVKFWYSAKIEAADKAGYARADAKWEELWAKAEQVRLAAVDRMRADMEAQRRKAAQANAEAQAAREAAREAAERETEVVIREVEVTSPSARECVFDASEAEALNRVR